MVSLPGRRSRKSAPRWPEIVSRDPPMSVTSSSPAPALTKHVGVGAGLQHQNVVLILEVDVQLGGKARLAGIGAHPTASSAVGVTRWAPGDPGAVLDPIAAT